ncbi:MAG: retropepsin-like aspartic protease family protein [Thermodesulfobacteriota bacterium]
MNVRRGDRIKARSAHGGVLLVPCLLNEAYRYWFLVDTGTAMTMLSTQVAEEMALDVEHPVRYTPIASVHKVTQAPVVRIDSLHVGGQRVTGMEVLVIPLPSELRLDGLLGVNFLSRFRPTFEFDQSIIVLRR